MTSDQFDQLLAALQHDALDWLSGLVVPLLLGGLTLFVAIWSIRVANRSNELAERIHAETMRDKRFERRLAYVRELRNVNKARGTSALLGRADRESLLDEGLVRPAVKALTAEQEKSGEVSARKMARWIGDFWTHSGLDKGDAKRFLELVQVAETGIDEWRDDPDAFMASVRVRSRFTNPVAPPEDPADPNDWRNP